MKKFLIFSLAVFCGLGSSNCGAIDRREYGFHFHGSEETFERAQIAAARWNEICGYNLSVSKDSGAIDIYELKEDVLYSDGTACNGITHYNQGVVIVGWPKSIDLKHNAQTSTLEHEFGHVLGLPHLPQGIMYVGSGWSLRDVTPYECNELDSHDAYSERKKTW